MSFKIRDLFCKVGIVNNRFVAAGPFAGQYVFQKIKRQFVILLVFLLLTSNILGQTSWPKTAMSKDGTSISYEVFGNGEPALVFIHGWSCDSRYWRAQIPHFSSKHRLIVLDLAGHGHSGTRSTKYTMQAFGEDVKAVVEAERCKSLILVGHSMGGIVIAEAARLIPQQVIGMIGVDTLVNLEFRLSHDLFEQMVAPLRSNFQQGCRQFVQSMFHPDSDAQIREWVLSDMGSANPRVALSAMEEMMALYINGDVVPLFDELRIPLVTVNGDLWPIDRDANRRHLVSFDAIVLEGADHFLMMNRVEEFNSALEKAILMVLEKTSALND